MERFTQKVAEHNDLRLIEARVPVMESAESGGTITICIANGDSGRIGLIL